MMNNHVISPLTISDFRKPDLKFFMRLGVISPSAVEGLARHQPRRHMNRDKVLGFITLIGASAAGWTAIAMGIARFLK
jgi:purine nucleoside permease